MASLVSTAVLALATLPTALGHSWIEQLRNIGENGSYVGEYGYPRGMVAKTDEGYNGDSMNFGLPAAQDKAVIDDTIPLCHPNQRKPEQSSDKYPRLNAPPGGFFAMRYMENGHVTKPENQVGKPEKGGTIFVYGTLEPKEDEKLTTVLQWSEDGQGGDKRGKLLGTNNFDDGRCYELSDAPESRARVESDPNFAMGQQPEEGDQSKPGSYPLFCETDAALPEDAQTGSSYTIYWVWQWNTAPKQDQELKNGKDEYYTTCIDIDVVDTIAQDAEPEFNLGSQQDAMSVAVSNYASRTALVVNPTELAIGPIGGGSPTGAPGANSTAPAAPPAQSADGPAGTSPAGAPPVPTITQRPGGAAPSGEAPPAGGDENKVTVTDTVIVTVTAPAGAPANPSAAPPAAPAPPADPAAPAPADPAVPPPAAPPAHIKRHRNSAKFRGMYRDVN